MERTLCHHIGALAAQTVQKALSCAVRIHLCHHVSDHGIGVLTPDSQLLSLFLSAQQLTQGTVGFRCGGYGGVNVDEGDSGLRRQRIQILDHSLLGFADIDDHIRRSHQQGFQIHLAFAAVELADFGFLRNLGRNRHGAAERIRKFPGLTEADGCSVSAADEQQTQHQQQA